MVFVLCEGVFYAHRASRQARSQEGGEVASYIVLESMMKRKTCIRVPPQEPVPNQLHCCVICCFVIATASAPLLEAV